MTGLENGSGSGLEFAPVTECGPGVAAGPEVVSEPGSVAGTGPEPGDEDGFGSGAVADFGPETEPGVEVGPEAVAAPGVGFEPVFEMELVPGGGTEVGLLIGVGPVLGPGPGARFGSGTETAPEVDFEQGVVTGFWVVAEFVAGTEHGPGDGFGLVLGPGYALLEPEFVAFAGLGHRAGPESVHRFGLDAGVGVEYGLGVGIEAAWVSQ